MADANDERLLLLVERIERLMQERTGTSEDIRDVYAEAKAVGYDTRTIRNLIRRRAMRPEDREEQDIVLEVYEAAVGMNQRPGLPTIAELRPDAAAIAAEMLAEQVAGIDDPVHAAQLVEHVLFLLDLRAEIAALRLHERERKGMVKANGFEPAQVSLTVRWFEKCAKHGEEAMKLGEAVFGLYRATVGDPNAVRGAVTSDPVLAAAFAPAPAKPKKSDATLERLRADAAATRRAVGGGF